jgi:hypothetical protein
MNNAMIEGLRSDSARRRQRVIKAINDNVVGEDQISVSAIAQAAGSRLHLPLPAP